MKLVLALWFAVAVFAARAPASFLAAPLIDVVNTDLRPETVAGFDRYVLATETRIRKQLSQPDRFLYIDGFPEPRRETVNLSLRRGAVFMQQLATTDASRRVITTPGGLIHHWIGDVFVPGVSIGEVLDVVQDYSNAEKIYYPQVVRSRLLSRRGNEFKVAMRFREKEIITVTLDTEHDVKYTELDSTHWSSRSISTRIAEVVDAGERDEHDEPAGHDSGFLWQIDSYWRFVQSDGGVYVECEAVSLSRDIPTGLAWLIKPIVTNLPKQTLQETLAATRTAARARRGVQRIHTAKAAP